LKTVLISAYTCCPDSGSEPGNGWNWLTGYVDNGYKVYCVTSSKYKAKIMSHLGKNESRGLDIYFTDSAVTLSLLKLPVIGIYLHYYIWIWSARRKIKKLVEYTNFSHGHHVTYSSIKFGTPLYNFKFKTILGPLGGGELPHQSLRKYLGNHFYFAYLKTKISNFLVAINPSVRLSVLSADLILTSNEVAKNTIRQFSNKETVDMFDAGLNDYFESPFTERDISSQIQLLWVGRILPRKGLNLAIEAISRLPEDFNFHFTIVGDGALKEKSKELVKQANLESRVTFLDRQPHENLSAIFRKSHILLFPSLIDSCPMQVFEAFAFGLPVVTLDHQGMRDQVNNTTGKKVGVGDQMDYPGELAKAILSICTNRETYNRYSINAYAFGQKQLWKKRIKYFLSGLYE
jgi:glycosyltransferase involved in cell wall biosynthesis